MFQATTFSLRARNHAIAKNLLSPDRRWCNFCRSSYETKNSHFHHESARHKAAMRNFGGMKRLATKLFEKHRGAPVDEDISEEKEQEILKYSPMRSRR